MSAFTRVFDALRRNPGGPCQGADAPGFRFAQSGYEEGEEVEQECS